MMYLKECLSYFKSYGFNHLLPICTLRNKFCIFFPALLFIFMFFNDMYVHDIGKYTPHAQCPSPIAKNLEFHFYYFLMFLLFLAIKSSWTLNRIQSQITERVKVHLMAWRLFGATGPQAYISTCENAYIYIYILHEWRLRYLMIGPHIVQIYPQPHNRVKFLSMSRVYRAWGSCKERT